MGPRNISTVRWAKAYLLVVRNANFTAEQAGFEASEVEIPENLP
jgi:hypothetical protein